MSPESSLIGSAAGLLLAGVPFVAVAVWVRRRLGRWPLVWLWLAASAALAAVHAALAAPAPGPVLARTALMRLVVTALGFGAASLAVHRAASRNLPSAPWPDVLLPLVSFAVGHVLGTALIFAAFA